MSYITTIKRLNQNFKKTGGRNNQGRISSFHRGGGHKKRFNIIDFNKRLLGIPAKVMKISYDSQRSANIALICYQNNILAYILAPKDIKIGDTIITDYNTEILLGNTLLLKNIPIGTRIHNISLTKNGKASLKRAAGTYATVVASNLETNIVSLKLNSDLIKDFSGDCFATIGIVSNIENNLINHKKAGKSRWLGKRPVVRGVAMNPVDHPHGGRTNGGRCSVSPWGRLTK